MDTAMKIWTSEHVFSHNWETVVQSQFRKYPNPHNTNVMGTDVLERHVDADGKLHSTRIITSDWKLAPWVQKLIGCNKEAYAHEVSVVDPKERLMTMKSVNLTFCSFVSMKEHMSYLPHPDSPDKTLLRQETLVTVRGVPLTSYMESLIVNTVDANAAKGKQAIEWVVNTVKDEARSVNISGILDKISSEVQDLKNTVSDSLINTAVSAIKDLKTIQPPIPIAVVQAEMDVKTSIASGTDAVSTAVRRERRTSQSRSAENL